MHTAFKYSYLTLQERWMIYQGIHSGHSLKDIANAIDRHIQTIISEVNRNGGLKNYNPHHAQNHFIARMKESSRKKCTKNIIKINKYV